MQHCAIIETERVFFFVLVHTKSLLETAMFVSLCNLNPLFIARACP